MWSKENVEAGPGADALIMFVEDTVEDVIMSPEKYNDLRQLLWPELRTVYDRLNKVR